MSQQASYFSYNGVIKSIEAAVVPVSNLEYTYGFGVYETIRVNASTIYFLSQHTERLITSAEILSLDHPFSAQSVARYARDLVARIGEGTYNLKLLLIGGPTKEAAMLYILCLNPYFPDRKLYKEGATCITCSYERAFPHAKSLNMLQSYLAYRKAQQCHAYDALLVNHEGCLTEGSRTNFFCLQGTTITTPKEQDILLGVMRSVALNVAKQHGFTVLEKDIPLAAIADYDGAFITSTSSKILPIKSIDEHLFAPPSNAMKDLMRFCNDFLLRCNGILE